MPDAKRTLPPAGGLLNKDWRYVPAANTDIRQTFERARMAQTGDTPLRRPVVTGGVRL